MCNFCGNLDAVDKIFRVPKDASMSPFVILRFKLAHTFLSLFLLFYNLHFFFLPRDHILLVCKQLWDNKA